MTGIPFTQTETCMMYQKQTDKNLISVMNKSIGSVSEEEQNEVIRHYSASSLNMLKEAPVDEIKLDMRFLSKDDPYGRAEDILHMIIAMGNSMRLSVLARKGLRQRNRRKCFRISVVIKHRDIIMPNQ